MTVTKELKNELGDAFLEVRGGLPKDARVVIYRKVQDWDQEGSFWPWASEKEPSYDTDHLKMSLELKECLLGLEPLEKHAEGKHRIYTADGEVATIMRIYEGRKDRGATVFDNLFSRFGTVKEELEMAKDKVERPLFAAAMNLTATGLHKTRRGTVTSLCKMIAKEDAKNPVPEVYDRLLEESEEFREKHGHLREALEEKVDRLQEAVNLVGKRRKSGRCWE